MLTPLLCFLWAKVLQKIRVEHGQGVGIHGLVEMQKWGLVDGWLWRPGS